MTWDPDDGDLDVRVESESSFEGGDEELGLVADSGVAVEKEKTRRDRSAIVSFEIDMHSESRWKRFRG